MTLLYASQVCRYWREVAFGCSHLWAQLILPDFQNSFLVGEFIRRSRSAPLSVESDCGTGTRFSRFATPGWLQVFKAADRIQSLRITFDLDEKDDIWPLENFVMNAAPLLQSCQLDCEKYADHLHPHGYLANLAPQISIFGGNAKELRCLSIHSCIVPPRVDFSGLSLTHLHLEMGNISTFEPTLSEWLRILVSQPLELLTLFGFRFRRSMTQDPREIQMPHLESLYLEGDINHCGDLFGALILPPTCVVHLQLVQPSRLSFGGMHAGLDRFLAQWDQYNGSSQVYHWLLETSDGLFRLEVGDTSICENSFWPQLLIECLIYVDIPLQFSLSPFLVALTGCPLMEREALIRFRHGMDPAADEYIPYDLIAFLSGFRNATSIMLDSVFIINVTRCILFKHPISTSETKENEVPVLLPNLKQIALENPPGLADEGSLNTFRNYLEWRHKQGKAIEKVLLIYPDLYAAPTSLKATDFYTEDLNVVKGSFELGEMSLPGCEHCDSH